MEREKSVCLRDLNYMYAKKLERERICLCVCVCEREREIEGGCLIKSDGAREKCVL
jgi:hypothetical protein